MSRTRVFASVLAASAAAMVVLVVGSSEVSAGQGSALRRHRDRPSHGLVSSGCSSRSPSTA
eukprot:5976726-Prymnesium_polylepis.1